MTEFNEIAPGGVGAPAEGVNPTTAQMEEGSSLPTVTPPGDVPVPPRGEPDQWIAGQRDVYSIVGHVATSRDLLKCPCVTVLAEQHADGSIGAIEVLVDVDPSHSGMSTTQARELAQLIVSGADLADMWVDRAPSPAERLTALRTQLHTTYVELRTAAGNAGDYLKAALDSLDDAIEVIR